MNTEVIKGIIVPIVTPVDDKQVVDEQRLRKQVDFVIDGGVSGILAFGSNGEFYMFDEDELKFALNIMLEQTAGRVPIYMGIGSIRTRNGIRIAQMADKCGAYGISILQPMFLKPTEKELYYHFRSIAESVPNRPCLLYNNSGRCGYTLSARLVKRLSEDVKNIVGMKDSSGDYTQMSEFVRTTRHLGFRVLAGKDTMIYGGLCMGTVGSVCTTANVVPELVCSIYDRFVEGDLEASLEQQFKLNPIRLSMDLASFPVASKDMANLRGLDVGEPILPSMSSSQEILDKQWLEIEKAGIGKI